ncbi:MAG TPA: carboxypeptidase-like regulatory domain-containing protein, partial [Isosphaeraceae bacterium]
IDEKAAPEPQPTAFRIDLEPASGQPVAFGVPGLRELDESRRVVLPDVAPGAYRLRVRDWLGLRDLDGGPLLDREFVVPAGGRGGVKVELGAGCITGKIPSPKENFERPVEVTAVADGGAGPTRRARCDDDGNFCLRYLTPGRYSVFIHDPRSGSCRVNGVAVPAGVVDVGEHALEPGATGRVTIRFPRPSRVPDEVLAVGPSGVTIRRRFEVYSSFDRAEFAGLCPGRWRFSATCGGEVLASAALDVEGTGAYALTLLVGEAARP